MEKTPGYYYKFNGIYFGPFSKEGLFKEVKKGCLLLNHEISSDLKKWEVFQSSPLYHEYQLSLTDKEYFSANSLNDEEISSDRMIFKTSYSLIFKAMSVAVITLGLFYYFTSTETKKIERSVASKKQIDHVR
jgi:hypothetical protein